MKLAPEGAVCILDLEVGLKQPFLDQFLPACFPLDPTSDHL